MGNLGFPELFLMMIFAFIFVLPVWRILKRTGHNPALSLLAVVPFVNIIALYVFAFQRWPIEDTIAQPK